MLRFSRKVERLENAVIETRSLTKSFGSVDALKSLSLSVPQNSIFGFLGPNGAGKTTTIKLILGLVKPTLGSATVLGSDIVGDSIAVRRRIGYLAQEPRYYDHMTARETLEFTAGFFFERDRTAINQRVDETLALVGLADKADRPIKGFSGGERQRLGIGQAQVHDPDLLILDEPAASLDPMGRRDVLKIMERLRERATVFYSTHILSDVQRVSDQVAIMNHGRLVAQAPIEQLLAGDDGVVYEIAIKGSADTLVANLESLESVATVTKKPDEDGTILSVSVTDDDWAERMLLRTILSDESVVVSRFGRRTFHLEDVFMNLVGDTA